MNLLVLALAVACGVYVLVRRSREARRRWLEHVHLQGSWECLEPGTSSSLDFAGGPAEGTYVESTATGRQRGSWTVHGTRITLAPEQGQPLECEFRFFEDGSIGIDGLGRERRIYTRRASNVVPLRSRR